MVRLGLSGAYFVPNQGQWSDPTVCYGLRAAGMDIAFRESSLTMHLFQGEIERQNSAAIGAKTVVGGVVDAILETSESEEMLNDEIALAVSFPGAIQVWPRGEQPQAARFNYFLGGEDRMPTSNVPSFTSVVYEGLYDGIDLHVTGSETSILKYEFHVAPGADYTRLRIAYDGSENVCVDETGDLKIETPLGTLVDAAPVVWQDIDGRRQLLRARYAAIDSSTYTIDVLDTPDPNHVLVLDPDLEWSLFLGGIYESYGLDVVADSDGDAWVTGYTRSGNFEGRRNSRHGGSDYFDAFALKVSPAGTLLWMTYLGGTRTDVGSGIAVDSLGNGLIVGHTVSIDFEGATNSNHGGTLEHDAFALKLNQNGQLIWMLYLGGTYTDDAYAIAIDESDNALIAGTTESPDFEGQNNTFHGTRWENEAFALKITPTGELDWVHFLGGTGEDLGYGVAADSGGNLLVTGDTESVDFEGRNNTYHGGGTWGGDAFVASVSPTGQVRWMTYYGGSDWDRGKDIAVDPADNAIVTGYSQSIDFEGRNNSSHGDSGECFVFKVDPAGQLQWMTYLGGSGDDDGFGVAVDRAGNALVAGTTQSTDFEGRNNEHHGGVNDLFILQVDAVGEIQWMTYLGGSEVDSGRDVELDLLGNALIVGSTESGDFEGHSNSFHGFTDAVLVKLSNRTGVALSVNATCPIGGPIRVEWNGATPDARVALIFARCEGAFVVPEQMPCPGTSLGLCANQIQVVWTGRSEGDGSKILSSSVGGAACGSFLQLIDLTTCGTSNVARIE